MPTKDTVDVLYKNVLALIPRKNEEFLELGRALQALKEQDQDRFNDVYTHQDIGKRMAQHLAEMTKVLEPLHIHDVRLKNIGVTKLIEIYPVIDKKNAEDWLKLAEIHTVANLKRLVAKQEPLDNARSVNLKFTSDEYELYRNAIMRHGGSNPTKGKGITHQEKGLINALKKLAELEGKSPKSS